MTYQEAIDHPAFSHARVRNWCRASIIYLYHHDLNSPSGVTLAASFEESLEIDAYLRSKRHTSALSPTEGM